MTRTQIERGRTALYLSSNLTNKAALSALYEDRKLTDERIRALSWWPPVTLRDFEFVELPTLESFISYFNASFRVRVLLGEVTMEESVYFFSDLNKQILDYSLNSLKAPSDSVVADLLFAFNVLMRATESAGITRAVGSTYFAPCFLSRKFRNWIISLEANIATCLDFAEQYYPMSRVVYDKLVGVSKS